MGETMKLSLDDERYAILREESDRLGMPVPRMIRLMCQNMAQSIKHGDATNGELLITHPQGLNNVRRN